MKLRCLLIDDEPPALKVLESHITQINGLEIVAQCKNALEALDVLSRKTVDLMFLDIKMPKMDGMEVLEIVKSNTGTKKIPVVILTSSKEDPDVTRSYDLGANGYIVKPVEFDSFIKTVSELGMYWMLLNHAPA